MTSLDRRQLRLLLVEDNPGDARLLAERLRGSELGVAMRHVESLAAALEAPAEETDLIHELGHQLCDLAFAEAARWDERLGEDAPYLLLNVSGRQFESERFVEDVEACAREEGLSPGSVYIEVTESVVIRASGRAGALRQLGFGVLIDDFGTGYASFHYLRDLAVDGLKVDNSVVQGVLGGRNERAIAATLLTLGNRLGVLTIAEGVETRAPRDEVEAIGCRLAQGFYLGRPMPSEELETLLGV